MANSARSSHHISIEHDASRQVESDHIISHHDNGSSESIPQHIEEHRGETALDTQEEHSTPLPVADVTITHHQTTDSVEDADHITENESIDEQEELHSDDTAAEDNDVQEETAIHSILHSPLEAEPLEIEDPVMQVVEHNDTHTKLVVDTDMSSHSMDPHSVSDGVHSPSFPVSPLTPFELHDLSRDSMTSIALSDTSMDYQNLPSLQVPDTMATPKVSGIRHRRKPSSLDIMQNTWGPPERQDTLFDLSKTEPERSMSAVEAERDVWARDTIDFGPVRSMSIDTTNTLDSDVLLRPESLSGQRRASGSTTSDEDTQVNWQKLDETEEQEKEDKDLPEGAEDESTAFLLARLEQENAKLCLESKSLASKTVQRDRAASRPPSMAQLRKLVSGKDTPTIRYSLAPSLHLPEEPPPMTELEFWAALVQDYPSTAVRLPTLTTTKIRGGIPPPLRGVVWTSMAGAREKQLEEAFDRLVHEKSPYEGIINKDVGRSFPGVELFREADGEGQRMLGRVLKCFSLQDKDIGYCQGLGFLVGPLLMNMGEREAFCVLVRLMDHYSLRPSFLPSLAGLHMRIFQFSSLLKQHNPKLFDHLATLGVEPAYLSQWFLSCFAVTCPLTMLFRIYDVIFAEGANETVMRVALALIRQHEAKILESTEFEEVMQLLLGREIWDCYGGDADGMVDDFTSLGDMVTHGRLSELEREFNSQSSDTIGQSVGFLPDVSAAASRFLGRLWAPGHAATASRTAIHATKASLSTLSPYTADREGLAGAVSFFTRPGSYLRRTPSKASLTMNDGNGGEDSTSTTGSGSASLASTIPTELDASGLLRESVADSMSTKSLIPAMSANREQQELHGQIEDLLTALSEMQREHAQLSAMLQREREERSEDHRAMKQIVSRLGKATRDDRRQTMPAPVLQRLQEQARAAGRPLSVGGQSDIPIKEEKPKDEMEELVDRINDRLASTIRFSASLETRSQLRSNLTRTREQLAAAESQTREMSSRLEATEAALDTFQSESDDLRAEVKELRTRVADEFKSRQKLEHQLGEMQAQARSVERKERAARIRSTVEIQSSARPESIALPRSRQSSVTSMSSGTAGSSAGLRELKLGRRDSSSSIQTLRSTRRRSQFPIAIAGTESPPDDSVLTPVDEPATPTSIISEPSTPMPAPTVPETGAVSGSSFGARTSSLAVQEVLATPEHEPIPEDALLLELVNSKTSEAQARQEIDELKRALHVGKRRQDEAMQQLRAEMEAAKAEAAAALQAAKAETAKALEAAHLARVEAETAKYRDASLVATPMFSLPSTPFGEDGDAASKTSAASTPAEEKSGFTPTKKPETPAPSAGLGGGWFWGRRTASKTDIPTPQ